MEYTKEQFLKNQEAIEKAQAWMYLRNTRSVAFGELCGYRFIRQFDRYYKFFIWLFVLIETLNKWYILLRELKKKIGFSRFFPRNSLKQSALDENKTVDCFDTGITHKTSLDEKSNVKVRGA